MSRFQKFVDWPDETNEAIYARADIHRGASMTGRAPRLNRSISHASASHFRAISASWVAREGETSGAVPNCPHSSAWIQHSSGVSIVVAFVQNNRATCGADFGCSAQHDISYRADYLSCPNSLFVPFVIDDRQP
jgi:hypothetical protein